MIIYNVTIKVEKAIAAQWLQWLVKEHISEVMASGCFMDYKILRLLETDEEEGPTYAIQYFSSSLEDYKRYIETYAAAMQKKGHEKWGGRFVAFRSVLEVVQ